jgi:hypothetical protein
MTLEQWQRHAGLGLDLPERLRIRSPLLETALV